MDSNVGLGDLNGLVASQSPIFEAMYFNENENYNQVGCSQHNPSPVNTTSLPSIQH